MTGDSYTLPVELNQAAVMSLKGKLQFTPPDSRQTRHFLDAVLIVVMANRLKQVKETDERRPAAAAGATRDVKMCDAAPSARRGGGSAALCGNSRRAHASHLTRRL